MGSGESSWGKSILRKAILLQFLIEHRNCGCSCDWCVRGLFDCPAYLATFEHFLLTRCPHPSPAELS